MSIKKVVLGISGGVDSAVSALLLQKRGLNVIGAFMRNWDEFDENGQCSGEKDFADAQFVCRKLDIPLVEVNFVKEYWNNIFGQFLHDYETGLTPNPDILCNRHIKFNYFYKHAVEYLGADAIATGHYARTSFGTFLEDFEIEKDVKLLQALDTFKDQTFFLSGVNQEALRRTMFPLGDYIKSEVKEIARQSGLDKIASKRESTGICFIGNRNFSEFIDQYIAPKPGHFVDIDTHKIVGEHKGIHHWTIGQRCRISGCLKPYFIAEKDILTDKIFVAAGTDHPSLYKRIFSTDQPSWIRKVQLNSTRLACKFRFQHTKPLVDCTIQANDAGGLLVELAQPLRAITPGQYAVFYVEQECLGCARILGERKAEEGSREKEMSVC